MLGLWMLLALVALTSCTEETEPATQWQSLYVVPCNRFFQETETRSTGLPEGYSTYVPASPVNIGVYMGTTDGVERGTFEYTGSQWRSDLGITDGQQYYIYGYMPKAVTSSATITPLEGTYTTGAVLTLPGLDPLSTDDVCLVVGVKQGDESRADITLVEDLKEGNFAFRGRSPSEGNYVYLLLHHLYAQVALKFCVETRYSELRTIKLKSVQLKTSEAASVQAAVTLRANDSGENPMSVAWTLTPPAIPGEERSEILFTDAEGRELTTSYQSITSSMFAPGVGGGLTLVCTYDVYDKQGNLVRQNCESENSLPAMQYRQSGDRTTLKLTIAPTYLYVMSDPDLDNPTLKVEN